MHCERDGGGINVSIIFLQHDAGVLQALLLESARPPPPCVPSSRVIHHHSQFDRFDQFDQFKWICATDNGRQQQEQRRPLGSFSQAISEGPLDVLQAAAFVDFYRLLA
eukprot:1175735-Prorocentrum_minimum.AAC.3